MLKNKLKLRRNIGKLTAGLFLLVLLVLPAITFAQSIQSAGDVRRVVNRIADFLFSLLFAVSVIVFIVAGFMYLTAGGNEKRVEQATKTITYAVVGLVVALLAYSIPKLIQTIIG